MPPSLLPGKEARKHINEAHDNYRRYERYLQIPEDTGWALVLLFYSAVHLVQAHAIAKLKGRSDQTIPDDHTARFSYIANNLGSIETHYSRLFDLSIHVRYHLYKPSREELERIHRDYYVRVQSHFRQIGFMWPEVQAQTQS
jgi:hypothetical protein